MKRPRELIYLIALYSAIAVVLIGFAILGFSGNLYWYFLSDLWKMVKEQFFYSYFIFIAVCILIVYGLIRGLPFGRNLSLIFSLTFMLHTFYKLLPTFTSSKLEGWFRAQVYINLVIFLFFVLLFTLSIHPGVSAYCKLYLKRDTSDSSV